MGLCGIEYSINEVFSFCSEIAIGTGLHQNNDGYVDPNTGRFLWNFKAVSPKNLSIGIRRHF